MPHNNIMDSDFGLGLNMGIVLQEIGRDKDMYLIGMRMDGVLIGREYMYI